MAGFLSGVICAGSLVAALFFVRFWRQSGDRLFAIFALAFTALAASRVVLTALAEDNEARTYVYLLRLASFLLIAGAIFDKNRARTR
jgi:hypothetical protein